MSVCESAAMLTRAEPFPISVLSLQPLIATVSKMTDAKLTLVK
jgi:hypothetical protein